MALHNNFADFAVFLYIYMAHADGEYHVKEEEMVKEKMKKLFPDTTHIHMVPKYEQAIAQYKSIKKEDLVTVIKDSFKYFEPVKASVKIKIYADMLDLIGADGKIDEAETDALQELKVILGSLVESL